MKNGKNQANIEIEICGDKGTIVTFHRKFDKDSKEAFYIDGKTVSAKDYLSRIKRFNIQVDNLCMFLPQDRVQDFTKLNAQELLLNTQISVCSTEITDAFSKLLKKREQQINNSKSKAELQTRLNDNRNRNEQLHAVIENNKQKDKLLAQADLLIKKKAWCEFEEIGKRFKDVENDVKALADKIKKKSKELQPFVRKQEEIAGTKADLKNAISKSTTSMNATLQEIERLNDAANKIDGDVSRSKQDMKNTISSIQNQKKQIKEVELLLNLERSALEEAKKVAAQEGDIDGRCRQFDCEIQKFKTSIGRLNEQRATISDALDDNILPAIQNCQRKIAILSDTQRQRVDVLKNNFEDAFKAFVWLQTNRQNFRGKIFNPIMVELTVNNKENAKYVENHVAMKDLLAFVCTDKNDMMQLTKKFRNEMKLQVNIAHADDTDEVQFQAERDIEDFPAHLGLRSYMIDMVSGPAPIINYLCKLYHIHNVVIGNDQTFANASSLPNEFRVFFSTNHRFHVNVSRYTGAKSTSSSVIQSRNILNVGVDNKVKENEMRNLANWQRDAQEKRSALAELEAQIKNVEERIADTRGRKKEVQQKSINVQKCAEKLRKKENELEAIKNRRIDIEEERRKFKNNVDDLLVKLMKVNEKRIGALIEFKSCELQKILAQKKLQVFEASTGNVDVQLMNLQKEIDDTRTLHDRIKAMMDATKVRYKAKEAEALQLTDGLAPSHPKFKYKAKFEKLPDSVDDLQVQLDELQGRIDCIKGIDPKILKEFEDRSKEIEELEHLLVNEATMLEKLENDIKELHAQWFPAIQNVVETINTNFSNFFNKMGFVGEVEMIRKEEVSGSCTDGSIILISFHSQRDYADYGIQIRVQYRDNEKLQALNRHVQSGGERAVAIAVYTLSLQHITSVPFRCVDEINQGMDPKNERKIFQMLVDITCQPGQSQYFFVTPKLLPDLPYNDLMTIHVVHNGAHIEDPYIFMDLEDDDASSED